MVSLRTLVLRLADVLAVTSIKCLLLLVWTGQDTVGDDWCNEDTGYTTITDGHGYPRSVFLSVTRDGSIWMRTGKDLMSDWANHNSMLKRTFIEDDMIDALKALKYSDVCVLSDLDFKMTATGSWHPSYAKVYDPRMKQLRIAKFKNNNPEFEECELNTSLSLATDKQGLYCDGGSTNSCGKNNLPKKGAETDTLFLKELAVDPHGAGSWHCPDRKSTNVYKFSGSYYHVYVKLAQCPVPTDSRTLGHEAKLREHVDNLNNSVLIPDATQTALHSGVIKGWVVFVKEVSLQHYVYLQVWRPRSLYSNNFTLVGQTLLRPTELRFQEVSLSPRDFIHVRKGDVLGLYFPEENPLPMSSVPCAFDLQHYRFAYRPSAMGIGRHVKLDPAQRGRHLCRQYSFTATLGNKTDSKLVEDWICPTAEPPPGWRKHSQESGDAHASGRNPKSKGKNSGYTTNDKTYNADGAVPVHLILIIVGCLLFLLLIIGFVSYYKAVNS